MLQWTWGHRISLNHWPHSYLFLPRRGISGSYCMFLVFWRIFVMFSLVAVPVYFLTNRGCRSFFSTFSLTLVILGFVFFLNNQLNRCEVITPCSFDLYFPDDFEHLFSTCWSFVYLFWWNVYSGPPSIFKAGYLAFFGKSYWYMLYISFLSDTRFADISFQPIGCIFILLMLSFAVMKLFSLM